MNVTVNAVASTLASAKMRNEDNVCMMWWRWRSGLSICRCMFFYLLCSFPFLHFFVLHSSFFPSFLFFLSHLISFLWCLTWHSHLGQPPRRHQRILWVLSWHAWRGVVGNLDSCFCSFCLHFHKFKFNESNSIDEKHAKCKTHCHHYQPHNRIRISSVTWRCR